MIASVRKHTTNSEGAKRVAIEAGVSGLWWKYVGTQGQIIGIDRFGISAPGNTVFKELGITDAAVARALA